MLAATGAVGCNFEDQVIGGEGIHPLPLQCKRIAAVRRGAGDAFFINARTDMFLKAKPEAHDLAMADAAIERAIAFADHGASGFFVPRLGDLKLLERVCRASPIPVNAIAYPGAPTKTEWANAGVARISHGPFPHAALMKTFEEMAREALAYRPSGLTARIGTTGGPLPFKASGVEDLWQGNLISSASCTFPATR